MIKTIDKLPIFTYTISMNKLQCPICGNHSYKLIILKLLSNEEYLKSMRCQTCNNIWEHTSPLYTPDNNYVYIRVPSGKQMALHRWVYMEHSGIELKPSEIVHHINHHKGDNRPSNLEKMQDYEHNGYFNNIKCCKRCGHVWRPRAFTKTLICPKCKSPYWDRFKGERKC